MIFFWLKLFRNIVMHVSLSALILPTIVVFILDVGSRILLHFFLQKVRSLKKYILVANSYEVIVVTSVGMNGCMKLAPHQVFAFNG